MEGKVNNMVKLGSIFDILGVTKKRVNRIPKNGYTNVVLEDVTCVKFRVARSLSKPITKGINTLLCPGNPEFQQESKNLFFFVKKLKRNSASIKLFGEKDYRIVAQSITASSFKMKETQTFIQDDIAKLSYSKKTRYDWEYTHG